jgi:hypothetical protein
MWASSRWRRVGGRTGEGSQIDRSGDRASWTVSVWQRRLKPTHLSVCGDGHVDRSRRLLESAVVIDICRSASVIVRADVVRAWSGARTASSRDRALVSCDFPRLSGSLDVATRAVMPDDLVSSSSACAATGLDLGLYDKLKPYSHRYRLHGTLCRRAPRCITFVVVFGRSDSRRVNDRGRWADKWVKLMTNRARANPLIPVRRGERYACSKLPAILR